MSAVRLRFKNKYHSDVFIGVIDEPAPSGDVIINLTFERVGVSDDVHCITMTPREAKKLYLALSTIVKEVENREAHEATGR